MTLSFSANVDHDPKPLSKPRIIKHLFDDTTPGAVFDLCRPYGPLFYVSLLSGITSRQAPSDEGAAIVHFYEEADAARAQISLHMSEFDGMTIAVESYDERKDLQRRATTTVKNAKQPSTPRALGLGASGGATEPPNPIIPQPSSGTSIHASRWAVPPSPAPSHSSPPQMTRAGSLQAGDVDPCNLILTNLDPEIDSKALFNAFRRFGTIVSARVMQNGNGGTSREFGFVSFTTEEAASKALSEMNGAPLGAKGRRISAAYHVLRKPFNAAQTATGQRATSLSRRHSLADGPVVVDALGKLRLGGSTQSGPSSTDVGPAALDTAIDLHVAPADPAAALTATSERDRLLTAVLGLPKPGDRLEEIVDLLVGLPSRERKLCLFNAQHLATKVAEARDVLEATDDPAPRQLNPVTPPTGVSVLPTPDPTPARSTTPAIEPIYLTVEDLAGLPATEIVHLGTSNSPLVKPGLLPTVVTARRQAVDAFVDTLNGQSEPLKKQKVGEKLFQILKSQGIKKAVGFSFPMVDRRAYQAGRSHRPLSLSSTTRTYALSPTSWSSTLRSSVPKPSSLARRRRSATASPHRVVSAYLCLRQYPALQYHRHI